MSQFVEVKAAELTGPALDWAVAKVVEHPADWEQSSGCLWFESNDHEWLVWSPSTDWAQGGPLIEQFGLDLWKHEGKFYAFHTRQHNKCCADTVLVAACRAIVAAKLGDVVQVPAELVGVGA